MGGHRGSHQGRALGKAIALGRAIAGSLPGETLNDRPEVLDGGANNREVIDRADLGGQLVRVKRDVFTADCCGLPWSRHTAALLERYNNEVPRGGAAVHPLHIVMHEAHRGLGQIVDLATRNAIGGFLVFSQYGLQRAGLTEVQAEEILGDGSILYAVLE